VVNVHGLDGVAQTIDDAGEGLEVPTLAALGDPVLAVILEGAEGDESVVARAAPQDLGARVTNMTVAYEPLVWRSFRRSRKKYR
jgi:hypothetical protein